MTFSRAPAILAPLKKGRKNAQKVMIMKIQKGLHKRRKGTKLYRSYII